MDHRGNVYVTYFNQILKISPFGRVTGFAGVSCDQMVIQSSIVEKLPNDWKAHRMFNARREVTPYLEDRISKVKATLKNRRTQGITTRAAIAPDLARITPTAPHEPPSAPLSRPHAQTLREPSLTQIGGIRVNQKSTASRTVPSFCLAQVGLNGCMQPTVPVTLLRRGFADCGVGWFRESTIGTDKPCHRKCLPAATRLQHPQGPAVGSGKLAGGTGGRLWKTAMEKYAGRNIYWRHGSGSPR